VTAPIHHIPLTYRDDPLQGGEAWLIGIAEHSVLGRRWIYDACGDPTYAAVLNDNHPHRRPSGRGAR
jgi:Maltokinase N-terminal cap domain